MKLHVKVSSLKSLQLGILGKIAILALMKWSRWLCTENIERIGYTTSRIQVPVNALLIPNFGVRSTRRDQVRSGGSLDKSQELITTRFQSRRMPKISIYLFVEFIPRIRSLQIKRNVQSKQTESKKINRLLAINLFNSLKIFFLHFMKFMF